MSRESPKTGITSSTVGVFYELPALSSLLIKPTAAGSAVVKISNDTIEACAADVASRNFTTGQAAWFDWTPGTVSAAAQSGLDYDITAAVCVPVSGTWTFMAQSAAFSER